MSAMREPDFSQLEAESLVFLSYRRIWRNVEH
jgi:hypothetical protein